MKIRTTSFETLLETSGDKPAVTPCHKREKQKKKTWACRTFRDGAAPTKPIFCVRIDVFLDTAQPQLCTRCYR